MGWLWAEQNNYQRCEKCDSPFQFINLFFGNDDDVLYDCQSTSHQIVLQYRYEDDEDDHDLCFFIHHVLLPHLS